MKKTIYLLLLAMSIPLFLGCDKEDKNYVATYTIMVASEKRIANLNWMGMDLGPCLMIKSAENKLNNAWSPMNLYIEGFQYEEGYEYTLRIKSYVDKELMDGGDYYRLDKVISKEKKNSVGLPSVIHIATFPIVVASEKRTVDTDPTDDVKLASCLMIKSNAMYPNDKTDEWHPFDHTIEGFEYEEGYEYEVWIQAYFSGTLADGIWSYKLNTVNSKVKKASEGLLPNETDK